MRMRKLSRAVRFAALGLVAMITLAHVADVAQAAGRRGGPSRVARSARGAQGKRTAATRFVPRQSKGTPSKTPKTAVAHACNAKYESMGVATGDSNGDGLADVITGAGSAPKGPRFNAIAHRRYVEQENLYRRLRTPTPHSSGYSVSGTGGDSNERPMESLSLNLWAVQGRRLDRGK